MPAGKAGKKAKVALGVSEHGMCHSSYVPHSAVPNPEAPPSRETAAAHLSSCALAGLGKAIQEQLGIACVCSDLTAELLRGARAHTTKFLSVLKPGDLEKARAAPHMHGPRHMPRHMHMSCACHAWRPRQWRLSRAARGLQHTAAPVRPVRSLVEFCHRPRPARPPAPPRPPRPAGTAGSRPLLLSLQGQVPPRCHACPPPLPPPPCAP